MTQYKCCLTCLQNKATSEYGNNRKNKDGLHHICKPCRSEYRLKTSKHNAEYYAQWRKLNKAKNYQSKVITRIKAQGYEAANHPMDIDPQVILQLIESSCNHCGTFEDMTIDHIEPLFKGGLHEATNLQPLCRSCNSKKHLK